LRSVIPILRSVARSCHIAFRFPVYKVLKAVAKIFLMNEVEAIFFAYMIKETNWDIKDKLITQNSEQVRDVVSISSDHPEYKNLILYLMLVTYSLKFFLNEKNEELLEEATKICPGFKSIF
jgi:D-ribose pyranose/furanose isomerase RbsD